MLLHKKQVTGFQTTVWDYYRAHKRTMPWRETPSPYYVLVSEMMLQQTQVPRVLPKFASFIARFPNIINLAEAPLSDVLALWSGLGYNRRAKFLWQAAKAANGELPSTLQNLVTLPGVGPNTAGAILAYAYNQPVVFIETNIRTVFIYHFFADRTTPVADDEIKALVEQTLPLDDPRHWYWALMDYGTHIKATHGAQLHKVRGYKTQSKFEGSRRQVRGKVLRLLLEGPHTQIELAALIADDRLTEVLHILQQEGLIVAHGTQWRLTA